MDRLHLQVAILLCSSFGVHHGVFGQEDPLDRPTKELKSVPLLRRASPVAASADGSHVAWADSGGSLYVIDAESGTTLFRKSYEGVSISAIAFSGQAPLVAVAGGLVKVKPGKFTPRIEGIGGLGPGVLSAADRRRNAYRIQYPPQTSADTLEVHGGFIELVSLETKAVLQSYRSLSQPIVAVSFASQTGELCAVDSALSVLRISGADFKHLVIRKHSEAMDFADTADYPVPLTVFARDGNRIASVLKGLTDNSIYLRTFDTADGNWRLHKEPNGPRVPWSLALDAAGEWIAMTSEGGAINVIGFPGSQRSKRLSLEPTKLGSPLFIAMDPAGLRVLSAGGNGKIQVWNAETGKQVLAANGPRADIRVVCFRNGSLRVFSGGTRFNGLAVDPLIITDILYGLPTTPK